MIILKCFLGNRILEVIQNSSPIDKKSWPYAFHEDSLVHKSDGLSVVGLQMRPRDEGQGSAVDH